MDATQPGTSIPSVQSAESCGSLKTSEDRSVALCGLRASDTSDHVALPSPGTSNLETQLCEVCQDLCDHWYDFAGLSSPKEHPYLENTAFQCALCCLLQRRPDVLNIYEKSTRPVLSIQSYDESWFIKAQYLPSSPDSHTVYLSQEKDSSIQEIDSENTDNPNTWEMAREWLAWCCEANPQKHLNSLSATNITPTHPGEGEALDFDWEDIHTPFNQRDHSLCHEKVSQYATPTRLIFVGEQDNQVRLCMAEQIAKSDKVAYAALSHSWGPSKIQFVTTTLNIETMLTAIPIASLGNTFKDAVIATRRLGLLYLWIDCLCIVQDDAADWLEESSRMGSIYANCTVNLVAAAAQNSLDGCFFDRPAMTREMIKLSLRTRSDSEHRSVYHCISLGNPTPFQPTNCITSGRAWCFQETFLAPRSLYFFKDCLAWECRAISASERYPLCRPLFWMNDSAMCPKFFRANQWHGEKTGLWSSVADWEILVTYYSRGKLSFPKDKLVAISGVARAFLLQYKFRGFNETDCDYFAGLWRKDIESQLLWRVSKPQKLDEALRSPSWSWASVNSTVVHAQAMHGASSDISCHVKLLDIGVNLCSSDSFGEVDGGYLKLSCTQLYSVMIEQSTGTRPGINLQWLEKATSRDKSRTTVDLDSTLNALGPAFALPILTEAHATEFGLLIRTLRSANEADPFSRVGYYRFQPLKEHEETRKVDDVAVSGIIVTIV